MQSQNNEIDIVYILGTGSSWQDREIRYSLRSVEKYVANPRIFIIGQCPRWLTGINHIEAEDTDKNKIINARNKYLRAASCPDISDNFILMNDDFFILKEITEWPYYSRGTFHKMIRRHPTKGGYYFKSLRDTKNRLIELGIKEPVDFEVHCPMMFEKKMLLNVMENVGINNAYSLRSCYGNLVEITYDEVMDFKANNLAEFAHQVKMDREFLSISDGLVMHKEFTDWIQRKFPKPSKWEADGGEGAKIVL